MATRLTYKDAGVDLDVYRDAMRELPRLMRRTYTPRVVDLPGGFAGLFRLDYNSRLFARNYREPVLVACTDGVGTKLKVAGRAARHDTVGIDLVAMCVNDCLCVGAEPLFFLDYVALPNDDPALLQQLVKGVADGCYEAECALLGGETAILPEVYQPGDYDLAGFCVGVVERAKMLDGRAIRGGDVVLGLASSGLHANGFSLVRKIVFEHAGLDVENFIPELDQTIGDALLEPTRIYVRCLRDVLAHYRVKSVVHGLAHVTGGGLAENLARILPPQRQVVLERGSWPVAPVFTWLAQLGGVEPEEMDRVFNMGIGFVLVVSPYFADSIVRQLADARVPAWSIGEVRHGEQGVVWAK